MSPTALSYGQETRCPRCGASVRIMVNVLGSYFTRHLWIKGGTTVPCPESGRRVSA